MEAASSRMAARYQFDGFPPPQNALQRYIYNTCDPVSNLEPNLALNLEIIDLINSKKGNAPREAAVTIVQLINHRNPNVSLLALGLLDICVKNCGYPFHLQISTKEFLNELVRRFPERPPLRASRVQSKILEAIEEWRATICQTSRYKEDLGFIRDMHRLLLYKGYVFPEVRRDDAAVLNPSDNLKSAEEMEEEEKAAQSAKLQELIRRGGPQDLQEANRLMKIMAGYDTRHKIDYRAKAAEEVSKVQQKAKILEEMLQGHKEGDKIVEGDVFEELANALQSAHPKIQRMCEEESDDAEAVAKLLEINDSIHRTVERYKLMKAGNLQAANSIPKGTLGTTTGVGKNSANELSLIDFDPEPSATPITQGRPTGNGPLLEDIGSTFSNHFQTSGGDDLLGLSLGGPTGSMGGIALSGANSSNFFAPSAPSPPPSQSGQTRNQSLPPQISQHNKPNYNAFASLSIGTSTSKGESSSSITTNTVPSLAPHPAMDPFAALVSSNSRPGTPSRQQNGARATSATHAPSILGTSSLSSHPPAQQSSPAVPVSGGDDDWNFVSSPPASEPQLPNQHMTQVLNTGVKIEFSSSRRPPQTSQPHPPIHILASFTNQSPTFISGLHFQVAVEKAYSLQLKPQTGKDLPLRQNRAITQEILVSGVPSGKGSSIKMRFKIGYTQDGVAKEEQGTVPSLGIV